MACRPSTGSAVRLRVSSDPPRSPAVCASIAPGDPAWSDECIALAQELEARRHQRKLDYLAANRPDLLAELGKTVSADRASSLRQRGRRFPTARRRRGSRLQRPRKPGTWHQNRAPPHRPQTRTALTSANGEPSAVRADTEGAAAGKFDGGIAGATATLTFAAWGPDLGGS